ncbi:hypothetical protein CO154_01170 [Candidatus Pacearchaeota archaeon CG_4_9_14_3_um_filter_31_7]|nr:MAG: hypothetical protein AUJ10_02905 [Candidatus Pacearchaeota archaeon CG1_02_31_27]PIN92078.1 MAG: hypothetical protein COU55_02735 [Candidatus Pacearchaeota archaeon CG10_big_fil_rev_8_21_14_0_10_31_59]PIZ80292.1 MAG: hypothetical protein COX99_02840 [Candidatus Pacearchaeota archaeon CG_4_10_14_0_2_um_filter_31_10]PJA70750.1 MAG: hypothetical protein CO154_01170 [Candidatus Pacearchaeota archaeon CG_4_9_14_3_um_filter_31_7]
MELVTKWFEYFCLAVGVALITGFVVKSNFDTLGILIVGVIFLFIGAAFFGWNYKRSKPSAH